MNPFEESFGRALETKTTGNIDGILSEANNLLCVESSQKEDTLHTPQLVPRYQHVQSSSNKTTTTTNSKNDSKLVKSEDDDLTIENDRNKTRESVIVCDIPKTSKQPAKESHSNGSVSPSKKIKTEIEILPQILLPKPTTTLVYATPLITGCSQSQINVKDKLKSAILSGKQIDKDTTEQVVLIPTFITAAPAQLISATQIKTTEEIIRVPSRQEIKAARKQTIAIASGSEAPVKASKSILNSADSSPSTSKCGDDKAVRNRAAAQRYRNKVKIKNKQMQDRLEKVHRENLQLKKEITELKRLLLFHKDCPITKALSEGKLLTLNFKISIQLTSNFFADTQSRPSELSLKLTKSLGFNS